MKISLKQDITRTRLIVVAEETKLMRKILQRLLTTNSSKRFVSFSLFFFSFLMMMMIRDRTKNRIRLSLIINRAIFQENFGSLFSIVNETRISSFSCQRIFLFCCFFRTFDVFDVLLIDEFFSSPSRCSLAWWQSICDNWSLKENVILACLFSVNFSLLFWFSKETFVHLTQFDLRSLTIRWAKTPSQHIFYWTPNVLFFLLLVRHWKSMRMSKIIEVSHSITSTDMTMKMRWFYGNIFVDDLDFFCVFFFKEEIIFTCFCREERREKRKTQSNRKK